MRVPICESDLHRNGAFKQIAKRIQRDWPGADRPGLMQPQELLARGLGYQSCHDLQRYVLSAPHNMQALPPILSESEVRERIQIAIAAHPTCGDTWRTDGHALVASLQLNRLQAFLRGNSGQENQAVVVPKVRTSTKNGYRLRSPAWESRKDGRILTLYKLGRLQEAVKKSGRLKDQYACGMLIEGLRASEVLAARAANPIVLYMSKSLAQPPLNMSLSSALVNSVTRYIQQEGIKLGDYIFNCAQQDGVASMVMLTQFFQRVVEEAGLEGPIRVHDVRRSVLFHRSLTQPDASH